MPLGHGLEQGRLCPGGCTVDLVSQHEIGEDWTRSEYHFRRIALSLPAKQFVAGDIRGHQVRSELDPSEFPAERRRECLDHQGLRQTRDADHEGVCASQPADQQQVDRLVLTHDDLMEARADCLDLRCECLNPSPRRRDTLTLRRGHCSAPGQGSRSIVVGTRNHHRIESARMETVEMEPAAPLLNGTLERYKPLVPLAQC